MKSCGLFLVLISVQLSAQHFLPYLTFSPVDDPNFHGQTSPVVDMTADQHGNTFVLQQGYHGGQTGDFKVDHSFFTVRDVYFIDKFDVAGNLKWTISSQEVMQSVAVDRDGNIIFEVCNEDYLYVPHIKINCPSGEVNYDSTCAMLVKADTNGKVIWTKKLYGEYYKPKAEVRLDSSGNIYWYVSKNFTNQYIDLYCIDPNGKEKWKTRLSGSYPTAMETSPGGDSYYCMRYADRNGFRKYAKKLTQFHVALYKTDRLGHETLVRSYEVDAWRKFRNSNSRYNFEHFVNTIFFTSSGNPVFAYAGIFNSTLGSNKVGGKKFSTNGGEFVFVLYDSTGQISWSRQEDLGCANTYYDTYTRVGQLIETRHVGIYYLDGCWLFAVPRNTEWDHFTGYTDLHVKNDMELFCLQIGEGSGRVTWRLNPLLSYRYSPCNVILKKYKGNILLIAGLSTEPRDMNRPYNIIYKLWAPPCSGGV